MAQEQIQELLALFREERNLTNSLQDRLDQETIMSHGLELGAQGLREIHHLAEEATAELKSQKKEMISKISHLEHVYRDHAMESAKARRTTDLFCSSIMLRRMKRTLPP